MTAQQWEQLLAWLQGLGMCTDDAHLKVHPKERPGAGNGLYATSLVEPRTPLFKLPSLAKLNARTLRPLYADAFNLSATQLISLHLCLHRPSNGLVDARFGPYISVLPQNFDSHPLNWAVRRKLWLDGSDLPEYTLLDMLPLGVKASLKQLEARFHKDHEAVQASGYLPDQDDSSSKVTLDYLWGWLNVNTRCLYDDLGLDREDNISLCPIFDFANHSWVDATMRPQTVPTGAKRGNAHDLICATLDTPVEPEEELLLTYGSHANARLFVEYGFVNSVAAADFASYPGEVSVDDILEEVLKLKTSSSLEASLATNWREELEERGYWGDWTMHSAPTAPAHPSFRVLTALRLAHVLLFGCGTLEAWRETLIGTREAVSASNEMAVRESLRDICEAIARRAENAQGALVGVAARAAAEENGWRCWAVSNVKALYAEENAVAVAVVRSVDAGEEF